MHYIDIMHKFRLTKENEQLKVQVENLELKYVTLAKCTIAYASLCTSDVQYRQYEYTSLYRCLQYDML